MAILRVSKTNSVTYEPIDSKFGKRDYVGDLTLYAKFRKIRSDGGASRQYGEMYTSRRFFDLFISEFSTASPAKKITKLF